MADVSVIIATHNRVQLVKEAIDSVLAQSKQVKEIIVVDDGSTDSTRNLLTNYGERIKAVYGTGEGASAARNRGLRLASGEWIAFLDDDDVWLKEKIERQMAIADQSPGLGLIYCSDYAVNERLDVLYTRSPQADHRGDVFERLLIRNFIFTSCVVARRDAIEKVGYMDTALHFAEDWDLWLRIAAYYPVDFAAEPLVLYRQSVSGCLTRDLSGVRRLGDLQTALMRALRLKSIPNHIRRKALFEMERQWAEMWLGQDHRSRALLHSIRAATHEPTQLEGYRLVAYSMVPQVLRILAKDTIYAFRGKRRIEAGNGNQN
jgi:glycosyltransferase involved in cell wall biosynthesis